MWKNYRTFLSSPSSPEKLISLKEVKTNKEIPIYMEDTSKKVEEKLKEKIHPEKRKIFEEIYINFNTENVFENEEIIKVLQKIETIWWIYENFIDFCNFLIEKIQNAKTKKEIAKIPQIISNLSNYKWDYKVRWLIKDKKNEVMWLYKEKTWKNNFLYKK